MSHHERKEAHIDITPIGDGWKVEVRDADDFVVCITGSQVKVTSILQDDGFEPLKVSLE